MNKQLWPASDLFEVGGVSNFIFILVGYAGTFFWPNRGTKMKIVDASTNEITVCKESAGTAGH